MSYSYSNRAVLALEQDYLQPLLVAYTDKQDSITFHTIDPNNLAYKLRQAFKVAAQKPVSFNKYSKFEETFKVCVKAPNKVIVKRRIPAATVEFSREDPKAFIEALDRLQLNEVTDLVSVVGAIIKHPQSGELYFPQVNLDNDELTKLYKFCQTKGFKIIRSDGLILTKQECKELEWTPSP
jgi:hypothetical protein